MNLNAFNKTNRNWPRADGLVSLPILFSSISAAFSVVLNLSGVSNQIDSHPRLQVSGSCQKIFAIWEGSMMLRAARDFQRPSPPLFPSVSFWGFQTVQVKSRNLILERYRSSRFHETDSKGHPNNYIIIHIYLVQQGFIFPHKNPRIIINYWR